YVYVYHFCFIFFFQAEDGIRDFHVTGVQTCALPIFFDRFYTDRPEHEEFGQNSGLGLHISKQIIEAHGGRIWAENRTTPEFGIRSEERRVGKECRSRWRQDE